MDQRRPPCAIARKFDEQVRVAMPELTDPSPIAPFLPATVIPDARLSDEKLEVSAALALDGERIRCERDGPGRLRIYAPTSETVWLMIQRFGRALQLWVRRKQCGGTVFLRRRFFLVNDSVMCPNIALVATAGDQAPIDSQHGQLLKINPNFVVEFCPHRKKLQGLKDKMLRWMGSGAELGWLIVPQEQRIYIYAPSAESLIMEDCAVEQGSLEEFVLLLSEHWSLGEFKQTFRPKGMRWNAGAGLIRQR